MTLLWAASILAVAVLLAAAMVRRPLQAIARELRALRGLRAKRLKRLVQFYNLGGDLSRPSPELLIELMDRDPAFFLRGPENASMQPPRGPPGETVSDSRMRT